MADPPFEEGAFHESTADLFVISPISRFDTAPGLSKTVTFTKADFVPI